MSNHKILIGIDPGSNTGIAVYHREKKNLLIYQYSSHVEAILKLRELLQAIEPDKIKFRIEDARKARKRPDLAKQNIGKAQGVGYVKAYSKDWEAFCKLLGYEYELLAPSNTKVSPEYFERLTGLKTLKGQSHMRDAALLIYGF